MRTLPTLGFASAFDKTVGDYVSIGGVARKVLKVSHEGRDCPSYYVELSDLGYGDCPTWVSWQTCGDVVL